MTTPPTKPTEGAPEPEWAPRPAGTTLFELIRLKRAEVIASKDTAVEAAQKRLDAATAAFKQEYGKKLQITTFAESAVFITPTGLFRWTVRETGITFEWSEALRLIWRIDAIAERARDLWWEPIESDAGSTGGVRKDSEAVESDAGSTGGVRKDSEAVESDAGSTDGDRKDRRRRRAAAARARERQSHLERAYGLMTVVLGAITRAQRRLDKDRKDAATCAQKRLPEGRRETDAEVISEYKKNLELVRPEVARAERIFTIAAQRDAQVRYGRGMLIGTVALLAFCGVLGVAFGVGDVPAWYGVAFPAGAVGALVSVLQRMTSGRLRLDAFAGDGMLRTYGAVRPAIGGVLGMVLFVLLEGGVLLEVSSDSNLAFYAAIGFLAGFNERFAQDMIVGSARRLGDQFGARGDESGSVDAPETNETTGRPPPAGA